MYQNWLLQLLCVIAVLSEVRSSQKQPLYLLSLLPYPDPVGTQPSWTEGPALILAEQLAVDIINNRTDILSDYTLKLTQGDSGCNIGTKATVAFMNNTLYSAQNIAGIVGPGCSTSAITVSSLSGTNQIALITVHGAGSLLLEDRATFPYSFGTLDSTKAFARAAQRLLAENQWNRVGTLYDPGRVYYSTTLKYFEGLIECQQHFECSTNFIFGVQNTSIPLDILRKNNIRIIYLFVGPEFLRQILCMAFRQNMLAPIYQWIIVSRVVEEITSISFKIKNVQYNCSKDDMKLMASGSLILHYSLKPINPQTSLIQYVSYTEFQSQYETAITQYNSYVSNPSERIELSFWATAYFDATWALALALNNSRDELMETFGLELSQYRYGYSYATDVIRNNLLKLDYNGVSGQITFRETTGYVPRLIDVYQVNNESEMSIVAYYNSRTDTITAIDDHQFINGTFNQELITVKVHLAIGIAYLLLTIGQLALIITLHILTLAFRDKKPVKASSPKLSHFAFAGCYILIVGATSYIIAETFSDQIDSTIKCNLFYVTYFASSVGGTLIFGAVCARIWRLYRIFVFYLNPGKLITDRALVTFILILFLCSLFLCSLWVGFDRLVPMVTRHQEITEQRNNSGSSVFNIQVSLEIQCLQVSSLYWLISQLAFNLIVMGIALCLAILTRRIRNKDFKTKRIVLLVYILSGVLVSGYITSYILQARQAAVIAQFIVLSTVHNLVIFTTAMLLLLPPVYMTVLELKTQQREHSL